MLRWKDVIYYAKYSNPEPSRRVEKSEEEWKSQLTAAQYHVMREKGTEPLTAMPIAARLIPVHMPASVVEVCFSTPPKNTKLFSGWPSFTQPAAKGAVKYLFDDRHHMQRMEVLCNVCDSHLGHVFPDGPEPGGLRYCINSESIVRLSEKS